MAETTLLDLTAQKVASTSPTKATECLLPVLPTNMPRLLLGDLARLLFMAVIVHWVAVWVSMAVLDRLSQHKLPKALLAAVLSVEDMIHLLAEATQVKTNTTTMRTKATNQVLVMT